MRLKMNAAVGDQAHKAGLESFLLGSDAGVTGNISRLALLVLHTVATSSLLGFLYELRDHIRHQSVDIQLRLWVKIRLTYWTLAPVLSFPLLIDASFAEVVSTRCCDRFTEHIQADAAQELVTGWLRILSSHSWTQELCFLSE